MTIDFQCPNCEAEIHAPDGSAGQVGACTKCGERMRVPGESQEPFVASQPPRLPSSDARMIVCPYCENNVSIRALFCSYCGSPLVATGTKERESPKYGQFDDSPVPPPVPRSTTSTTEGELAKGIIEMVFGVLLFVGSMFLISEAKEIAFHDGPPNSSLGLGIGFLVFGLMIGGCGLYNILVSMKSRHD